PNGPAIFLLERRQASVRVLAAVFRVVIAAELTAPVDALVRNPELAYAPHRLDDVRAIRASPDFQHVVSSPSLVSRPNVSNQTIGFYHCHYIFLPLITSIYFISDILAY